MEKPIFGNIVGVTAPSAYVSYDQEMNLSNEQKTQARNNIGAISVEIAETPKDGEILVYDAATNKLVNSGYTINTFKQWVKDYIDEKIPTVTAADEGKFIRVSSDGKLVAETIPSTKEVAF